MTDRPLQVTSSRRAAVLGAPIAHSLSPVLHRAAYAELGLHWTYSAVECGADELPAFLDGLDPSYAGLSLTMPLKEAVLPLLDEVSPLAEQVGAANTVLLQDGRRLGDNTDVAGVVAALAELPAPLPERVVVLGAGGTARAVLAAIVGLDPGPVDLVVRSRERAAPVLELADVLGLDVRAVDWTEATLASALVVNATPEGAADRLVADAPWPGSAHLLEVLYHPWPTALAAAAEAAGAPVVGGLSVLVGQAVEQVELMTGLRPTPAVLHSAGAQALAGG